MDRPPLWGKFLFATVMLGAAVAFSGAGTGCASSPAKSKRADAAALAARPG